MSSSSEFETLPLALQPLNKCRDLGLSENPLPTATNDESLLAAGLGPYPVMAVIDTMLALRKETAKFPISSRIISDTPLMNSSKRDCREHSEAEELSQSLMGNHNPDIHCFVLCFGMERVFM